MPFLLNCIDRREFHNRQIYRREQFTYHYDTNTMSFSIYNEKKLYQRFAVFRIIAAAGLFTDLGLLLLCFIIAKPVISSWSLVSLIFGILLLLGTKAWYYFFCFKQRYYRSNVWNYKISTLWILFDASYAFIFIALYECWTFLVYKRSTFDILVSIIVKNVDETLVETSIATDTEINQFYTKIVVSAKLLCLFCMALMSFMHYVHKRNIFTDLRKPPDAVMPIQKTWTDSLRRLLSYNSAGSIPSYNDNVENAPKDREPLFKGPDMDILNVSDASTSESC